MVGINKMIRTILQLWENIGNKGFWGGIFDSRFYVAKIVHKKNFDTTLDLGSGNGIILHLINAKFKVGIDIDFKTIIDAKKFDQTLEIICGDIRKLPFKNNYFNSILSSYSISGFRDVNDRKLVYDEIIRVSSKNNSTIIITVNNILSKYLKKVPLHKRKVHVRLQELVEYFESKYMIKIECYNPFPRWKLYILKIIILKSPKKFLDVFNLEEKIFNLMKSEKELHDSRSFILTCTKNL